MDDSDELNSEFMLICFGVIVASVVAIFFKDTYSGS